MDPWQPQAECADSIKDIQTVAENKFDDCFVEAKDVKNGGGEPADSPRKLADTDKYLNKLCKYICCFIKLLGLFFCEVPASHKAMEYMLILFTKLLQYLSVTSYKALCLEVYLRVYAAVKTL